MIPYARQWIGEEEIAAVAEVLRSDWLTTGPWVEGFEHDLAAFCGARHGVAVSSGTAALHAAVRAAGVRPGDEVIVPCMTFAATANAVVYEGGVPRFADVDPRRLLIDPESVRQLVTDRTRAIIGVDYAGHPCDYEALSGLAGRFGLKVIADACHSLGGSLRGRNVGTLAGLTSFSFHPVKQITTGEGGMVVTDEDGMAAVMRRFRNHGLDSDHRARARAGGWRYSMVELGWNYRLTDIQCALGRVQLRRLPAWIARRRAIASRYDELLAPVKGVVPLGAGEGVGHAYHLYVVRLEGPDRETVFDRLRSAGIGVNVHYTPVHLHPFYRERYGTGEGTCPVAEEAAGKIISLPMYPGLEDREVERVAEAFEEAVR